MIAVNYAARAYGVKRGDSVPVVKAKCPSVKLVHVETLSCNSQGISTDGSRQVIARADRPTDPFLYDTIPQRLDQGFSWVLS